MSKAKKPSKASQQETDEDKPAIEFENSPGKQLVKARDELGLTQQQVADRLHLRLNSVQAVEQDALENGVSATFNKGYVRLYARLVHLEIEPLLLAYDRIHKQENQTAQMQSFSKRVTREAHDHRWNMVTIVVVLLVIGSVIGWWVQQSDSFKDSQEIVADTFNNLFSESENQQTEDDNNESISNDDENTVHLNTGPEISEEAVAALEKETNELSQEMEEEALQDPLSIAAENTEGDITETLDDAFVETLEDNSESLVQSTETLNNNVNNAVDELTTAVDENNDEPSEPVKDFAASAAPFTEPNKDIVVNSDGTVNMAFTFKDDCWVSIKDVNDEIIAIGVKAKDRVMEVSGLPPIQVTLCAPQKVDIVFGDNNVDMSSYSRTRTANFTLLIENN